MDEKALPTISGTTIGCVVEQKNEDGIWKQVNFNKGPIGIPNKRLSHNIIDHVYMYGEEQAMALAWWLKARNPYKGGDIRVVPYKIQYSVECFRNEDDAVELPGIGRTLKSDTKPATPSEA